MAADPDVATRIREALAPKHSASMERILLQPPPFPPITGTELGELLATWGTMLSTMRTMGIARLHITDDQLDQVIAVDERYHLWKEER